MTAPSDLHIPLLTEIIHLPPEDSDAPTPMAAQMPTAATAATAAIIVPAHDADALQAQAIANWDEREWDLLQYKLSDRILRQLQGRIDFVLEQRVRDSLADVLQVAMVGLTSEIKRGLQHTMEEVIGRAVAQEIARLQTLKK
jgi:hypothetical protein